MTRLKRNGRKGEKVRLLISRYPFGGIFLMNRGKRRKGSLESGDECISSQSLTFDPDFGGKGPSKEDDGRSGNFFSFAFDGCINDNDDNGDHDDKKRWIVGEAFFLI